MTDVVDSLLNDAVDLYVQVVDYRRIPTNQIPALVGAGIWKIMPESGYRHQIPTVLCHILARLAESLAIGPRSSQNGRIPTSWLGFRQDGGLPVN
jgi:hypothetical protein